eukprot:Awhi_evm1s14062
MGDTDQHQRSDVNLECSLPMYDFATASPKNDILFKYLSKEIVALMNDPHVPLSDIERNILEETFHNEQVRLQRPTDDTTKTTKDLWASKKLLFTHMCGQPFSTTPEYQNLEVLGTPIYNAEGCSPGKYRSFIIAKKSRAHLYRQNLASLAGSKLVINHPNSFSGCIVLKQFVLDIENNVLHHTQQPKKRVFFHPKVLKSGSHRASVKKVSDDSIDDADIAAIDCITFSLLPKVEIENVTIIAQTRSAPAPPIVYPRWILNEAPGVVHVLQQAFTSVFNGSCSSIDTLADLFELKEALAELKIEGFATIGDSAFYRQTFLDFSQPLLHSVASFDLFPTKEDDDTGKDKKKTSDNNNSNSDSSANADTSSLLDEYYERLDRCGFSFSAKVSPKTEAQTWFNRAVLNAYGFNHQEAELCFLKVLEIDADVALAHWGVAYVRGMNYNHMIVEAEDMQVSCKHIKIASAILDNRNDNGNRKKNENEDIGDNADSAFNILEQGLIKAMSYRCIENYGSCKNEDEQLTAMTKSNVDYGNEMRKVFENFPDNPDVACLFAESLMNKRPWNLWPLNDHGFSKKKNDDDEIFDDLTSMKIHPETLEIQRALEKAIQIHPPHPGLAHFYIHLMELSPLVKKSIPQADLLRSQWPACGHLLHMASHIDMQCGKYEAAISCNLSGIEQDKFYSLVRGSDNYYHGYRIHNHHMLTWAAMFAGKFEVAMKTTKEALESTPQHMFDTYIDWMEPYLSDTWMVLIRFGKWNEILEKPLPDQPEKLIVRNTWARYARCLAFSALGKIEEAKEALLLFEESLDKVPETRYLHNVKSVQMFAIAREMLHGELEYRCRNLGVAFKHLRKAVELEDGLPYDEPWGWM